MSVRGWHSWPGAHGRRNGVSASWWIWLMLIVVWAVIAVVWLCLVLLVYAPVAAGRAIGRAWRHARPRRPSAAE